MTSTTSVAVVFIAPVIMSTAHLCTDASLFTEACLAHPSFITLPTFCHGVRKTSAAYSIHGTAMERYSCHIYFVLIPQDNWASCLNWISQSYPFTIAATHCPFQFNLLSTMMPRNFAISFQGMHWLPSTKAHLGIGILFLGFSWCGVSLCVMSRSWNFSMPNSQLWSLAHSNTPPAWFIMFCNFAKVHACGNDHCVIHK